MNVFHQMLQATNHGYSQWIVFRFLREYVYLLRCHQSYQNHRLAHRHHHLKAKESSKKCDTQELEKHIETMSWMSRSSPRK
jgi:hypothetical protein